ncbi:MAG TPA: sigma-70 family RNA polymerase sigma factor [Opitutaceae bacterium]|nr:sigma-70 family RNA polymerase sigma factor [Opitutaceae bacterium]
MPSVTSLPTTADVSDLTAVDEVCRGNREMFEVLVRRYNQQLFRIGIAYLRNHQEVEDAMQNAYLKAFVHLSRFERSASFSTWLTRIMINECLMTLRRRKRTAEKSAILEIEYEEPHLPQGESRLNLKEMKTLLESAIGRLPSKFRAIYLLREVQQMTTSEAAACLGISIESAKVNLHRARERLKLELMKSAAGMELFSYEARFCDPMTARVMQAVLAVA